jgi:hypothetical protein
VVTGWQYPNGKAGSPISEYCYYSTLNPDGTLTRIDLGAGGKALAQNRKLLPDFDGAFASCQWWHGA